MVICQVNEEERAAKVIVPDYQLSLAIGKEGQNARLAARLMGWKIDVKSESKMLEEMAKEQAEPSDAELVDDVMEEPAPTPETPAENGDNE